MHYTTQDTHKIWLVALLFLFSEGLWAQLADYPVKGAYSNVGDIPFDSLTDNPAFRFCDSVYVYQYYNFGTKYKGEKSKLREELLSEFQMDGRFPEVNGIITIRFVINCRGETDRFRVLQVDKSYKKASFPPDLTRHLLTICRNRKNWLPGDYEGRIFDQYAFISFIFQNGRLRHITP